MNGEADNPDLSSAERPISIIEVEETGPEFDAVLALWRRNRQWLGFLPTQGFADRAVKGTLLAAVRGSAVVGYVLYDLPRRDLVKVVHLCVAESQRRRGTARALIDAVSARHQERRGIALSCRRDFPASRVWPRLGFAPRQERPGRGDARRRLTIWIRDHGHPDLFTFDPATDAHDRLAVALDHNVVIDLLTGRAEGDESTHLEDAWLTEYIVLCITDEIDQEINKSEDPSLRDEMRKGLLRFKRLPTPAGEGGWEELVPIVRVAAPQVDAADQRHLARAKAGGASHFVSRDAELNGTRAAIFTATGVQVMRPAELIVHVDRLRAQERYEPTTIHATSWSIRPVADEGAFVTRFLNYAEGERRASLAGELRRALAEPAVHDALEIADEAGTLVGGVVRKRSGDAIQVRLMRVAGSDRLSYAVARQLAYLQRREAADSGPPHRVVAQDKHVPSAVRYALEREGYKNMGKSWVSEVRLGIHAIGDLAEAHGAPETDPSQLAAALERRYWPMRVTGTPLPTFMVPIRPVWAEQLFDSTLAAGTLFGRQLGLGLSREHVYYRKPRNANGIAAPARIVWYVSGQASNHPEGSIRAVSQLAEVVVSRPRTVHQRFARLGVYDAKQVEDAADDSGQVMALRFTDTELLAKPITLSDIRSIATNEGTSFTAPLSPRRMDERFFARLYQEASAYAE